jgi:Mrp family chromosome partitioning ATPase
LEALQFLRAKLQFASSAVSGPVLVVTSGQEGEGKSIAVASLGLALSAAGNDVICVDADLYRPRLHEYLALPPNLPGFSEVLNRQAGLDDVLQDVTLGPTAVGGDGTRTRSWSLGKPLMTPEGEPLAGLSSAWGSLQVVSAGRQDAAPEPFDESRLADLLAELRNRADYVVFDTPPVLLVGDAFPLLIAADTVIVVARRGWTRKGAAEAVRVTLDGLAVDRVSVILTDSDEREDFRYGGGYYRRPPSAPKTPEESGVV